MQAVYYYKQLLSYLPYQNFRNSVFPKECIINMGFPYQLGNVILTLTKVSEKDYTGVKKRKYVTKTAGTYQKITQVISDFI